MPITSSWPSTKMSALYCFCMFRPVSWPDRLSVRAEIYTILCVPYSIAIVAHGGFFGSVILLVVVQMDEMSNWQKSTDWINLVMMKHQNNSSLC